MICNAKLTAASMTLMTLFASLPVAANEEDLATALTSGDVGLNFRYRYELVDQDAFDDDAHASNLRLRLNYSTGNWRDWSGFVEFDQVIETLSDNFNSGAGTSSTNRNRYPVVADPNGADLNQVYVQYSPNKDWQTRIGRQRILLDNQRFVGGVGWRQNEQTYDGVSLQYNGFHNTIAQYTYVANVNRIFGSDVAAGDHEQNTHLLNVKVALQNDWSAVGYAYLIDNDDAPAFSSNTFGLRINGSIKLGEHPVSIQGELATQSDATNSPVNFDANYFKLEALWKYNTLTAGIGFESLGSDNGQGFRTPLATLHAFNGWADQFLATPATGLDDLYLKLGYRFEAWNLQLIYHDLSAEAGGDDYGTELDLSLARKLGERYGLLLKLASFDADSNAFFDTNKLWLMLTANY